jgi:glycosyltransferase A (GT-A) superfamily protein (DUF2064 family)
MKKNGTLLIVMVEKPSIGAGHGNFDQSIFATLLLDTVHLCKKIPHTELLIAVPPTLPKRRVKDVIGQPIAIWQQEHSTFTIRLREAFELGFEQEFEKVIILGTHSPTLHEHILEQAVRSLQDFPLVLGPLKEGGYYLVGESLYIPDILQHLRWNRSPLQEMMKLTAKLRIRVKLLPELEGLDTSRGKRWDPQEILELKKEYLQEVLRSKKISISLN